MPAPRRLPRMRLVTGPTGAGNIPAFSPGKKPRATRRRIQKIRIPKVKEKVLVHGPTTLEKASASLAAYALRQNRMNRRSSLPTNTREMIDAERNRIRGLQTPKDWKNYLNSLERGNEKYLKPSKQKGEIVWKQDERKSIRIGKKKGEPMKQLSLTNYGKFEKLYTDPAGRKWSDMTREHQQRMAEYVVRTMDKYHASTQQNLPDGTYRRMRQNEVLQARIPELQKMITTIQKKVDSDTYVWNQLKKEGSDPVMTNEMEKNIHGMKNRMSILQGSLQLVEKGTFSTPLDRSPRKKTSRKPGEYAIIPNERALIVRPEQKTERPTIPYPGAAYIQQMERGGIPHELAQKLVQQRLHGEKNQPLTQEEVRRRQLNFDKWQAEIAANYRANLRKQRATELRKERARTSPEVRLQNIRERKELQRIIRFMDEAQKSGDNEKISHALARLQGFLKRTGQGTEIERMNEILGAKKAPAVLRTTIGKPAPTSTRTTLPSGNPRIFFRDTDLGVKANAREFHGGDFQAPTWAARTEAPAPATTTPASNPTRWERIRAGFVRAAKAFRRKKTNEE